MVPTGDSLGTEPSPNRQEMTLQPGHPQEVRASLPVLSPAQRTPQGAPILKPSPGPSCHAPRTTPAGKGVTDAWLPQLTPTMSNRVPQTLGLWLRRKGCMRSRERECGREGFGAKAAREERSDRGWLRAQGRTLRFCNEKGVLGRGSAGPGRGAWGERGRKRLPSCFWSPWGHRPG